MIKSLIIFIFLTVSIFALSGQSVYDNKYASCHAIKGMIDAKICDNDSEKSKVSSSKCSRNSKGTKKQWNLS